MSRKKGSKKPSGRKAGRLERVDLFWALGLTLLAWVHRILFLLSNRDRDWPFTIFYQGDAHTFFLHARALIRGDLYDEGIPFHPPGFPMALSLLHRLLGAGGEQAAVPHRSVKIVLALLASAAVGLLFLLVRPYVGRLGAALAALLSTYHFGHYVLSIAPVGEGLFLTLLLAALLLWSRRLEHPLGIPRPPGERAPHRPRDGLFLGILGGALALLRYESVLILAGLVAVGLWPVLLEAWRARRLEKADRATPPFHQPLHALAPWLLVALGWVLVVAPWTARNHRTLSDYNERMGSRLAEELPTFVPVTLYGPINLALANQEGADGSFSPAALTGATGGDTLDLTRPKHLEWLLHGDRIAWRWIREHPGDFARLVVAKWRLAAEVFALGFLQENWPGGLDGVRRPVDIFVPDARGGSWLLPLLAAIGLALAWRREASRRYAFLALFLTACFLLTTALFYGYVRLALLYLPFWLVLAAVALAAGIEKALEWPPLSRYASKRGGLIAAGLLASLLLLVDLRGAGADRNFKASASSTVDGHHLNPDDEIRLERIED